MNNPPCSKWSIWEGKECEGKEDFGVLTLFVRSKFNIEDTKLFLKYKRVWFTREFTNYSIAILALGYGLKVCIEVSINNWHRVPNILKEKATIYFVLPVELKRTDFIKNGNSFEEQIISLRVTKTNKKHYYKDRKIK